MFCIIQYKLKICISILIYVFLVLFTILAFDLEKGISKNWTNIVFYQKFVHLGENTFPYCSQIIVVHVYVNVFSIVHPGCHNIVNGINPEKNSKTTDKHAAECSNDVCWGVK